MEIAVEYIKQTIETQQEILTSLETDSKPIYEIAERRGIITGLKAALLILETEQEGGK